MVAQITANTWGFLAICSGVLLFVLIPLGVVRKRDKDTRG